MESLRVEGLRSLKDSGYIDIKPITLLLGENSSGKSTFLRTFPLLRQSLESSTRGPILWYGSYVDFGSFDDALSNFGEDKTISFSFKVNVEEIKRVTPKVYSSHAGFTSGVVEIKLTLINDTKAGHSRVQKIVVEHNGNTAELEFSRNNKLVSVISNKIDLTELFSNATIQVEKSRHTLFPHIAFSNTDSMYLSMSDYRNPNVDDHLTELITPFAHGKSNINTVLRKLNQSPTRNKKRFVKEFQSLSHTQTWNKRTKNLDQNSESLDPIHAALFAGRLSWMFVITNAYLSNDFANVSYVAPLRATAERYYRNQELSVDEVDFQGKNLVMFIKNLSDSKKKEYRSWLSTHFGFTVDAVSDGGHLTLRITYDKGTQSYNVTDMGFGFSQILPIITQLWFTSVSEWNNQQRLRRLVHLNRYLVIEQPELHLHPRFQAKMIDVFVKMVNLLSDDKKGISLKIVIETHSETIINQLGMRIRDEETQSKYLKVVQDIDATEASFEEKRENRRSQLQKFDSTISKDDVSIVLFDKLIPNSPTEVSFSRYDSNGNLEDWPWGFFEPEFNL